MQNFLGGGLTLVSEKARLHRCLNNYDSNEGIVKVQQ